MNAIILSNTIIDRDTGFILEREDGVVRLYVPGLAEPHTFSGEDAHELWKFYDGRAPEWRGE